MLIAEVKEIVPARYGFKAVVKHVPDQAFALRSRDEGAIPEPPDMPCVSDTGATAPISALTSAFSIGSDRGLETDDSAQKIVDGPHPSRPLLVTRSDNTRRVQVCPQHTGSPIAGQSRVAGLSLRVATPVERATWGHGVMLVNPDGQRPAGDACAILACRRRAVREKACHSE